MFKPDKHAIFNSTNPPHMRDAITLNNIGGDPEMRTDLGGGYHAVSNLGLDWKLNRDSFFKAGRYRDSGIPEGWGVVNGFVLVVL